MSFKKSNMKIEDESLVATLNNLKSIAFKHKLRWDKENGVHVG